jgi:hypothetical protein
MRMWNVDPKLLCRQHLLGEHLETHYFIGTIKKGKSIKGYIDGGLVEVHNILRRHDELAEEMKRRGYKHSHNPDLYDCELWECGCVDSEQNIVELHRRCKDCRERIENGKCEV